jgi:hypothetical protein
MPDFNDTDTDDDADDDDIIEPSPSYPAPLDLAWSIYSRDPNANDTPLGLHASAVKCMIRAMDSFAP